MESKKTIQIDAPLCVRYTKIIWSGDAQGRAQPVVGFFAMWDEDIKSIGGAAQKDDQQCIPS